MIEGIAHDSEHRFVTKAEKRRSAANRSEYVENDEDGIVDVHAQVEQGLSELLTNLRSGSVKLSGDKASNISGIIAQVPILIKAVTTMSEAS